MRVLPRQPRVSMLQRSSPGLGSVDGSGARRARAPRSVKVSVVQLPANCRGVAADLRQRNEAIVHSINFGSLGSLRRLDGVLR